MGDACAHGHDEAPALMAGDERGIRFDGPVAFNGVQIGVADAARFNLHQQFARTGAGYLDFFDYQGLAECACNCGLHGLVHHYLRSLISFTMLERPRVQDHDL
ncbi:hypothetical protein G6F63_016670 [Rhizopus arrhizus]|nr:hypothetical protein G6F63_016670 [Rhizopus arrhizus]